MWSVLLDIVVPLSFRPHFLLSVIVVTRASRYLALRKSSVFYAKDCLLPDAHIDSKPLKP